MKNFNQKTKFKPHWHFFVFLKIWYFISSSFWNFQSALFKTKRRCFFGTLTVAALYEQVNKVAPLNAVWLGSYSGAEQWSEAEAQMVVVRSCNVFSQETPDVGYVMNGSPWTDKHTAILTLQDVMTAADMLRKINNLFLCSSASRKQPRSWYNYSWE